MYNITGWSLKRIRIFNKGTNDHIFYDFTYEENVLKIERPYLLFHANNL
jgi:hypothetical protein